MRPQSFFTSLAFSISFLLFLFLSLIWRSFLASEYVKCVRVCVFDNDCPCPFQMICIILCDWNSLSNVISFHSDSDVSFFPSIYLCKHIHKTMLCAFVIFSQKKWERERDRNVVPNSYEISSMSMVFMVNEIDLVWRYFPINHINPLKIARDVMWSVLAGKCQRTRENRKCAWFLVLAIYIRLDGIFMKFDWPWKFMALYIRQS